jgi:ATP-dependent Lon protease
MEIIRLSGYIAEEKLEIARRYLVPKAMKTHGLKEGQVTIRKEALRLLIENYAREAGVRSLENLIKKVARKSAMKIVKEEAKRIVISKNDVEAYLGKPIFTADEMFDNIPGVVTGLAWTSMGGATLQIEATAVLSKAKGFRQTGQLGAVMVESAEIAYSYIMAHLERFGAKADFFDERFVHIHVPAGATPKDGPSAGITMATALLSFILKKPVRRRLAMTGELTLTGQVLPIGGVKEKVIGARRVGCKYLIFPEANRKDYDELPEYLRKGLSVSFAGKYEDVYKAAFGEK